MCIWLLAVLDKGIGEASRLDLFEHGIGVCLDGISADLHMVIFLRRVRFSGHFRCCQSSLDLGAERIHRLTVLREPVHHIAVIAGDAQLVPLTVADNIFLRQSILFAEIDAELDRFLVNGRKIRGIGQTVLADFEADMRIITGAFCTAAAVPSAHIPRQGLVCGNGAVSQLSNKTVDADLTAVRRILVPMIVVLVFAEQSVIRADVTFEVGIVRPGGMHHNALRRNGAARLVAGVVRQNEFMQIHKKHLTVQINCQPQARPGTDGR